MEHFRRWGLARAFRSAAFLPVEWSQDVVFCVNLLGPETCRTAYGWRAVGASYEGSVETRHDLTAVFDAPGLAALVPHGPAIQYWVLQPEASAYMGRLDLRDRWWIGLIGVGTDLDEEAVASHVAAAVGEAVDVKLVGTDPWVGRTPIADRHVTDHVLLAGDAAHLNPPWGGHGFSTGIGDAVNAAWKVAAALAGWGGAQLVEGYAEERRPVDEVTVARPTSTSRGATPPAPAQSERDLLAPAAGDSGVPEQLDAGLVDRPAVGRPEPKVRRAPA